MALAVGHAAEEAMLVMAYQLLHISYWILDLRSPSGTLRCWQSEWLALSPHRMLGCASDARRHISVATTWELRDSVVESASTAPRRLITAISRHRRRHVYRARMDAPVLKLTALKRRSF